IGLEYVALASPKRSRLDDWFLGSERADQPCSAPVPFFLEVHEELTNRTCFAGASALTILDGGAARGYVNIPQRCHLAWPPITFPRCLRRGLTTLLARPPHVFMKIAAAALTPPTARAGQSHPQLPRRLADSSSVSGVGLRTQGPGAAAPSPIGPSGQLGEEQALPCAEHLFSLCGVRLSHHDSAPFIRPRSVNAELLELLQAQDSGPTETISEAPGAFRIRSHSHAAWITSHETASALASRPSPKMGMVPRHTSSGYHSDMSPPVQPLVGPCISTGGSALRPSVQACCGYYRRFQDRLGLGFLDGPPSAMAHQLPRVADCALSPEEASAIDLRQASTVAHINRQGGLRSRRMSQLAHHLLICSLQNRVAVALSRQVTFHGEWRLHPHTVQLIWNRFDEAQIDLFASYESTHCALWYSLTEAPLGTDALAHSWPRGPRKYAFPPVSLIAQTLCKVREERHQVLMVAPYWPNQTCVSSSLANSPEEGPSFSGAGHNLAPAPRPLEPPRLVPGQDEVDFGDPSPAVIDMIAQARPPSTRQPYALKWHVFNRTHRDVALEQLREALRGCCCNEPRFGEWQVLGKAQPHNQVPKRINPPRPRLIPSWDLSVVLLGLQRESFEPLQSVELGALSMKTALLIALTSLKRVGDLQALSVCDECLEFGPAYSHVVLRPRPGYVPKVHTTPFRDQVVNLPTFPSEGGNLALSLLCPVHALRVYLERTQSFRQSEQLFVCFGDSERGRLSPNRDWLTGLWMPYSGRTRPRIGHSTRGIAVASALAHSASLADICRAAGWATPNTFARFYNLRMEPVSSRVFGDN
ncbi:hypothetical protein M9458_001265, partial [Cirrhinus mrigala]